MLNGRHTHLRELGLPTFFGAAVLLVSATLLLGANISALHGNLKAMDHSQQVLAQISDLEGGILRSEMTVRGYALSGDESFLSYHRKGRARANRARDALAGLLANEPQRAETFRRLTRDLDWHQAKIDSLTGIGPDRAQIVARAIVDPAIRANSRRCSDGLAALRAGEFRDLAEGQQTMASQLSRAFYLSVGITLAAFLLGSFGAMATQFHSHGAPKQSAPARRRPVPIEPSTR